MQAFIRRWGPSDYVVFCPHSPHDCHPSPGTTASLDSGTHFQFEVLGLFCRLGKDR
jgi:hypothetical protein